jgi:hypothetical protein
MADVKRKGAAKKRSAAKSAPSKKPRAVTSEQKRAARDVFTAPSSKQIERSLSKGRSQTLEFFRGTIDWD